jgi:uncharacterized protein YecA (UPF0149 family)
MEEYFLYNERLGISLPEVEEWEQLSPGIQQAILLRWELTRGMIPDRIANLEKSINIKQAQLENEENFQLSCKLNNEIAELASIINDLWLWFRTNQNLVEKVHQ